MQRIATLTAIAAVLGATVVAMTGMFAPEPAATDALVGISNGGGLDRNSAGILAGAFIGAAVALLSHTLVSTALKFSTEAAFKMLTVGFAAKALGAVLPWAAMNYLPQVGRLADSTAYLVAYAIVVVLVLGGGLFDHLRAIANGSILNTPEDTSEVASERSSDGRSDEIPTEIKACSSDQRSGSASSSPRSSIEASRGTGNAGSATSAPPAVFSSAPPSDSSDSLESAT